MDSSTDNSTMSSGSRHQSPPETPSLCSSGCGFFGTPENLGLCSKCHKDYLKEKTSRSEHCKLIDSLKSATITETDSKNPSVSAPPIAKNRCGLCNKRVGLLGFECRCGGTFCGIHRYPEAHPCEFDFKSAGKIAIEKENPVCTGDKIRDRL